MSKGKFTFIDALSESPTSNLGALFDKLSNEIHADDVDGEEGARNLVVLDGISLPCWMGVPTKGLKQLVRAVRAICYKVGLLNYLFRELFTISLLDVQNNGGLLVRTHSVPENETDALTHFLVSQCSFLLEVLPLESGRSGSISGEVCATLHIMWGFASQPFLCTS